MRFHAVSLSAVLLCCVASASAQHHGHAHHGHAGYGHSYYGHNHGGYGYGGWGFGGQSSYLSSGVYYGTPGFAAGIVSPYCGYGWGGGYYPPAGYYGGYGGWNGYGGPYYGTPYYNGYGLPPLAVPAEALYGPSAVRRLMGVDPPLGTPIVKQTIIAAPKTAAVMPQAVTVQKPVVAQPAGGFGVVAGNGQPPAANVPPTNALTQARAGKLIDAGDASFQRQQYAAAFSNYKDAVRTAPDLAEAYLRLAAASVAIKRYDDATAALKFGLRLSTDWVDGPFRIAALYGDDKLAQSAHLDALAQAAIDRTSSDLLFLTGAMLYFSDPPQRAEPLLRRAAALTIGETWHIDAFLRGLERQRPVAQNNGGARDL